MRSDPRTHACARHALFFIGLFAQTQIQLIGYIGISELACFVMAPFFFIQDNSLLRKHGFMSIAALSLLCLGGSICSNYFNQTLFSYAVRGMAAPYSIFSIIVCLHHFLFPNIRNFKWLLLGLAISTTISVFVFQSGEVLSSALMAGEDVAESALAHPYFWYVQLRTWLTLPMTMEYLKTPSVYANSVVAFLSLFSLLSAGGRSSFAATAFSLALLVVGGKKQSTMLRIRRNFISYSIAGVLLTFILTGVYRYTVVQGYMGEDQERKYERQSEFGTGLGGLIMGGRSEFFVGLIAALDKPFLGHGAWAPDNKGYYADFLSKYGSDKDYKTYFSSSERGFIPAHSQVIGFWLWFGIFGLLFWLYVFYIYFITLGKNMAVMPEWYGYLALWLPGALWNFFFSPFGNRVLSCSLITVCLFVKAVAEGRLVLPLSIGSQFQRYHR